MRDPVELLQQIAARLDGIELASMHVAEKQIATLLVKNDFARIDRIYEPVFKARKASTTQ